VPASSSEDAGHRRPDFTVADEARLVRDGVRALRDGQAACALSLLDTHARYDPEGVLTEEREAERAMALAELGRVEDARAVARAFLRAHPTSPLGPRLRQRIPGLPR
jgi:outer membrane protein assembly factor BamD (BamD/ComL family)